MALGGACLLAHSVTRLRLAEGRPAIVSAAALSVAALWLFLNAGIFVHTTRAGKFAVWAELLDRLELKGDERLLDIGCGRGAVLLMAAERLPRGRAVGVDLWSTTDQSGNAEQVTRQNAGALLQICQRLDGIPLAIELAAARMTLLSPDELAHRLDRRFQLLSGGSRTDMPRQQTLRGLVDWSHELLSPEEKALFRRLSVFAGGWPSESPKWSPPVRRLPRPTCWTASAH